MSRETWKKNIVFSHFSRNLAQKAQKTLFSHDLRTLCIVPRKTWKNNVFSHILLNVAQDDQRTLIFAFSAKNVQSVSKDVEKHGFLTLFAECRAKSLKTVFFAFLLRTLYKESWRTWKNIVFTHFLRNVAQKVRKTLFFCIFGQFRMNCLEKREKHCFLTLFVGRRAKS